MHDACSTCYDYCEYTQIYELHYISSVMSKLVLNKIAKVAKDIYKLIIYAQIIYYSAHYY